MILPLLLLSALSAQEPASLPAEPAASTSATSASSTDATIASGLVAFKRRRFSQAEIEFRKAMEADPSSAAATFYLAYTYYKLAEPKRPFHPDKAKAASLFARAYELDPRFKPVWSR